MKLKYLYDNRDLTKMILENWNYDEDSLNMLDYYRISSNAIYPFQENGETRLLRFAPVSEKDKDNVLAELKFIKYLNANNYPALKIVASKKSEEHLTIQTPWGEYYATVFERVAGTSLGETDLSDQIVIEYGKTLGKLHKLSSGYLPVNKRWSYDQVLEWIKCILVEMDHQEVAIEEVGLLQNYFAKLPQSIENYGFIHYDFELDNVFYDQTNGRCHVIDFDDAMYHWYVMDIEQALESLCEKLQTEQQNPYKKLFIQGYRMEYAVTDDMLHYLPIFRRFANLYGYTRIIRSIEERWDNEPEWVINLRSHLDDMIKERQVSFGKPF